MAAGSERGLLSKWRDINSYYTILSGLLPSLLSINLYTAC